MAKILIRIDDAGSNQIKKKAADLGLTTSAYIRQVLKDSLKTKRKDHAELSLKLVRANVIVMAEALGRTLNASPETTDKLKKTLLKIFDQEVQ